MNRMAFAEAHLDHVLSQVIEMFTNRFALIMHEQCDDVVGRMW